MPSRGATGQPASYRDNDVKVRILARCEADLAIGGSSWVTVLAHRYRSASCDAYVNPNGRYRFEQPAAPLMDGYEGSA